MFTPSPYQQAIFDFVKNGKGHGIVQAVAGSGKTTTNIQALDYVDPLIDVVFLAFNKHIADELKSRGVQCASTFHSLGKANITSAYPRSKFNQYKLYDLLDRVENTLLDEVRNSIIKLIALLKANLLEATKEHIDALADTFDIDIEDNEATIYRCTRELLEASVNDITQYDFDDMIYWPAIGKVGCKKFDFIFVDESQDLNKSQITFAENSMATDGRMLLIGDPYQSIYAFRGAFTGIMDYMQDRLNATVLPLSISYRAPKVIVNLVNSVFPHICFEGSQTAKEGYISNLQYDDLTMVTDDGDAVICRTNAPLVKPAFQLLKEGRKAVILGRDIGQGLITLVNKRAKLISVKNADNPLAELLFQLQVYFDNEKVKLERMKRLGKLATLQDQIETIVAIADGCETISQLKAKIESIFSNNRSGVVFSSIHKAKGLEWENVFILRPELMPHPMAKDPVQKAQENNLKYVSYTRSKCNLYLVQGGK